jgi:uncharacterized protein (DUF169 family)
MRSLIAEKLGLACEPVAVMLTDEQPETAKQFKPGKWGCVMFMLAAAARGQEAVFDRTTYGCWGGGVGLGFGNVYEEFPGGVDGFCYFLSVGNQEWETGRQVAEQAKPYMNQSTYDDFVRGERYLKSPELVRRFVDNLPMTDISEQMVVFKPLSAVEADHETPATVVFLADMDQMAALTILANYHRETNDNVIVPYAAGCQAIGIYPLAETASETPRAVLGQMDISARVALKRILKQDLVTFAAPFQLFEEMEANVENSFVERNTWQELMELRSEDVNP